VISAERLLVGSRGNRAGAFNAGSARVSLRTKGIVAFVLLVLYIVLIAFLIAQQRATLRETVEQQRRLAVTEEALARVNSSLAYAVLNVNDAYANPRTRVSVDTLTLDVGAVQAGLHEIEAANPAIRPWVSRLDDGVVNIRSNWGPASLAELRATFNELVAELDAVTSGVRSRQNVLTENFRVAYDSITITSVLMGLIGATVFGGVVMLFFSRMVWDLRKLQGRAMEVVSGYRGRPIEITRKDEIGALMESVNSMQSELRERERQLEIARQQRFHQEKMAAIGSLAAAIAHEVNNPIAAITGVAEAIHDNRRSLACPAGGCRPELILEQTRRISQITRQLAEMTAPYSPEPQLLDLNTLVRKTCGFVRYDRRFRDIELRLDLDPQLPAVRGIADHLTQILMNLLINAADATAELVGRRPMIMVSTETLDEEVVLAVADNGCGMDAPTLARAFEEAFTTKPPGRGSGLGLFMCRLLIEAEGGRIALESNLDEGTRATIHLPRPAQRG
jgi:signal transduction histidine kinase